MAGRRHIAFALALGAGMAALGADQIGPQPDAVVTDRYAAPDFGEMRLKGICSVTESSIQCWDRNRKPDAKLGKEVGDIIAGTSAASPAVPVPIHVHRKNRIAVFLVPTSSEDQQATAHFEGFRSPANNNVLPLDRYRPVVGDYETKLVPIDAELAQKTSSVFATIRCKAGEASDLTLKEGASVTEGNITAKVASITQVTVKPGQPGWQGGPASEAWKIELGVSGKQSKEDLLIGGFPADAAGMPIMLLDNTGKPAVMPKPGKNSNSQPLMQVNFHGLFPMAPAQLDRKTGTYSLVLGVNPKYVSKLKLDIRIPRIVEFKEVPL